MNITSWTSEGMDWSSWETVKPWRREYIEAIRKALRNRCEKARSINYGCRINEDKTLSYVNSTTVKVCWDRLERFEKPLDENLGILAFSSFFDAVLDAIKALCPYFANPAKKHAPVAHALTDVYSGPLEFYPCSSQSLTYPTPTPGYFASYAWGDLRHVVSAAGVELVGSIPSGALMDSAYVRKWFHMVKAMLDLLIYMPFAQPKLPDVVVSYLDGETEFTDTDYINIFRSQVFRAPDVLPTSFDALSEISDPGYFGGMMSADVSRQLEYYNPETDAHRTRVNANCHKNMHTITRNHKSGTLTMCPSEIPAVTLPPSPSVVLDESLSISGYCHSYYTSASGRVNTSTSWSDKSHIGMAFDTIATLKLGDIDYPSIPMLDYSDAPEDGYNEWAFPVSAEANEYPVMEGGARVKFADYTIPVTPMPILPPLYNLDFT